MTKTAKEVIANVPRGVAENDIGDWLAADIIAALDGAGFVIMKRPKGGGTAIPDYVPDGATSEQMREVIQSIGGLLMQNGYEANSYLDLHASLFAMVVHFQDAQYFVEELDEMFEKAKDKGHATIQSAVGAKFNKRVVELMNKLQAKR